MKAAFGGYLGPEMKGKADQWAHETPDIKGLPVHKNNLNPIAGLKKAGPK